MLLLLWLTIRMVRCTSAKLRARSVHETSYGLSLSRAPSSPTMAVAARLCAALYWPLAPYHTNNAVIITEHQLLVIVIAHHDISISFQYVISIQITKKGRLAMPSRAASVILQPPLKMRDDAHHHLRLPDAQRHKHTIARSTPYSTQYPSPHCQLPLNYVIMYIG